MSETKKCGCGKPLEGENAVSSITGDLNGKPVTMCMDCFRKGYELKRGKSIKTNIFVRKKP